MPDNIVLVKNIIYIIKKQENNIYECNPISLDNEPPLINAFNEWNRYQH